MRSCLLKFSTPNWLNQLENLWKKHSSEIEKKLDFSLSFSCWQEVHGLMPPFGTVSLIRDITEINCPSLSPFLGELRPLPTWDRTTFPWQLFFFRTFHPFSFYLRRTTLSDFLCWTVASIAKCAGKCQNPSKTYDLKKISRLCPNHLRQIIGWVKPKIKWKIWLHKYCSTLRRCWPAYPSISAEQKHPLEIASIIAAGRCL